MGSTSVSAGSEGRWPLWMCAKIQNKNLLTRNFYDVKFFDSTENTSGRIYRFCRAYYSRNYRKSCIRTPHMVQSWPESVSRSPGFHSRTNVVNKYVPSRTGRMPSTKTLLKTHVVFGFLNFSRILLPPHWVGWIECGTSFRPDGRIIDFERECKNIWDRGSHKDKFFLKKIP